MARPEIATRGEERQLGDEVASLDTATRRGVKAQHQKRTAAELQEESDLLAIVSTQAGKRILWQLLASSGVYSEAYMGAGRGEDTAFRLGQQAWGRRVVAMFSKSGKLREAFRKLQDEAENNGW